jgi:hypothetical protein
MIAASPRPVYYRRGGYMRHLSRYAAIGCLLLLVSSARSQSVLYNFSDGTSDGWAQSGFGSSPPATVVSIGGQNYINIPLGGFQVANVSSGTPTDALFTALVAAAANPSGYDISYDWQVDTSTWVGATFFQVGTFVNSGSGAYAQDFPATGKEVELNGVQTASGQIFSGHVDVNFAAAGLTYPATDNFYRLGLIENGNGTGVSANFTNISVHPVGVPEPGSLGLLCLALPVVGLRRWRR